MSSLVTVINGSAVTNSLVIAEGTKNDHASVIKLVRSYIADLEEFGLVRFEIRPRLAGQHGGADVEFAVLNEQQSTLLLTYMRNSDVVRQFKKALVKAFFELMQQAVLARFNVPATYPEAMRLAADLADQKAKIEAELVIAKPKAEVVDRISEAGTTLCIRDSAKTLQIQPSKLTQWMLANKWIYHRPGKKGYLAYQDKIQKCYLVHKSTPYRDSDDGEEKISEQVRITGRGLTLIAQKLNEYDGVFDASGTFGKKVVSDKPMMHHAIQSATLETSGGG